jgi:hypothetical protein
MGLGGYASSELQRLALGAFLLDCRGSQSLATIAQSTPTLIRKVLLLLLLLRGLGRSPKEIGR